MRHVDTPAGPGYQFEDAAGDTVTLAPHAENPSLRVLLCDATEGDDAAASIWLTREQAGALAAVLANWAETGTLPAGREP